MPEKCSPSLAQCASKCCSEPHDGQRTVLDAVPTECATSLQCTARKRRQVCKTKATVTRDSGVVSSTGKSIWLMKGLEKWIIKVLGPQGINGTAKSEHMFLKDP